MGWFHSKSLDDRKAGERAGRSKQAGEQTKAKMTEPSLRPDTDSHADRMNYLTSLTATPYRRFVHSQLPYTDLALYHMRLILRRAIGVEIPGGCVTRDEELVKLVQYNEMIGPSPAAQRAAYQLI